MISIIVNGTEIYGKLDTKLTSGSVGRRVTFVFDSAWDGLLKTAVFKVGDDCKDWYLGEGTECSFPWELLKHENVGKPVSIGVCGMRGEDTVYPTIYTYIGELAQGATASDDPSIPPTPELVQQFINLVEESKDIAQSVRDDADNGMFDGDAAHTDQVFNPQSKNAQSGIAIDNFVKQLGTIKDVTSETFIADLEDGIYRCSIATNGYILLDANYEYGIVEGFVILHHSPESTEYQWLAIGTDYHTWESSVRVGTTAFNDYHNLYLANNIKTLTAMLTTDDVLQALNDGADNEPNKVYSANVINGVVATITDYITRLFAEKENISNKATEIDNESTDKEYPTAKAVFDFGVRVIEAHQEQVDAQMNELEERLMAYIGGLDNGYY